jgi:hypothetical protein
MSKPNRLTALYPVMGVAVPAETAAAFQRHFGLNPVFATDWYVHLKSAGGEMQLGLVRHDHVSVPADVRRSIAGTAAFVTVDADDVAAVWADLRSQVDIVVPLADETWGQRHFICRLPGEVLVDVVQLIAANDLTAPQPG